MRSRAVEKAHTLGQRAAGASASAGGAGGNVAEKAFLPVEILAEHRKWPSARAGLALHQNPLRRNRSGWLARRAGLCRLGLLMMLITVAPGLLAGCAGRRAQREWFAMDTVMQATVYGGGEAALDAVEEEVGRLEALLSARSGTSEITAVNAGAQRVSEQTAALVNRALALARETEGAYDPTVEPLMRLWGFAGGAYRVPSEEELAAALVCTGAEAVCVAGCEISLPEGFALDLGGIAKGYAAEQCKERLRELGVTSALLSLGGNVSALGAKPDGSPWTVAIEDPDGGGYLGTVEVADACVVTSGGYQRYFEKDGMRYWHILDPASGAPARSGMKSVTIVSDDDTLADALSTALFVMGPERATEYWRAHRDEFEAVFLTDDGTLLATEGLQLHTERPCEVIQ